MATDTRRRIVTVTAAGVVATLLDLENGTTLQSERDSLQISPPPRQQQISQIQRRYGGSRVVGELHDNGQIGWTVLVKATTADLALAAAEGLLGQIEACSSISPLQVFYEWRPAGATFSTYYEIRGPGSAGISDYSPTQFSGALSFSISLTLPVAPLCFKEPVTQSGGVLTGLTTPSYIALASAIPGDAPALMDVAVTHSAGAAPPVFAMIGWAQRPTTPLSGAVAPFGIIEAETGSSLAGWAAGLSDATYRGSNGLRVVASGAGTTSAQFVLDPATMVPDVFSPRELDVELWACVELDGGLISPTLRASLVPNAGVNFGSQRYASEDTGSGILLTKPSGAGTPAKRFVRLGVLSMVIDLLNPIKWNLQIDGSYGITSSGKFGLDYLILVPARARALNPTRKANDATYPKFIKSTAQTSKLVRFDGSAVTASGATVPPGHPDAGLGGSLMEIPTGNVDLVFKLSSLVPDDPTSDATTEQLSHAASLILTIWPRYWLARAA